MKLTGLLIGATLLGVSSIAQARDAYLIECVGNEAQQWKMVPAAGGVNLVNRANGEALDYETDSRLVNTFRSVDSPAQRWKVEDKGDGTFTILNAHTGMSLDFEGLDAPRPRVRMFNYVDGPAQRWRLESTDGGYYRIINNYNNKCLDYM
ncbi:RICIN domain-containing protein [Sorangium sp. So ce1078]|uniref:RICIN domain-containing protein n=1 Tax=Sorangium sp. So ce1078 TaxID=3133329 RepID=UPI003F647B84